MGELLKNPAVLPALIALGGVIVGGLITGGLAFLNAWLMKNRELRLKLSESFLERRMAAHETVIALAVKMRFMCPLGPVHDRDIVRTPQVMQSKECFDDWLAEFAQSSGPATTWLATPVKRELHFVQDYLVTVHTNLAAASSEQFPIIGAVIHQDFIDLSSSLEKAAYEFFKAEVWQLRLSDLSEHHKYPLEQTTTRLQKTVLISRWQDIKVQLLQRPENEPPE